MLRPVPFTVVSSRVRSGAAVCDRFGMNFTRYVTMPKNRCSCSYFLGSSSFEWLLLFLGLLSPHLCSEHVQCSVPHWLFPLFNLRFRCRARSRTSLSLSSCSASVSPHIRISLLPLLQYLQISQTWWLGKHPGQMKSQGGAA